MFGENLILKPKKGDGNKLDITDIFLTFQGEGMYTGHPAVFVRLGGCNLKCEFCDTEFDEFDELPIEEILEKIIKLSHKDDKKISNLVVITGGEPFRQPVENLCFKLLENDFSVQIETNGTLYRKIPQEVDIICSPKNVDGKYHEIRSDLLPKISAFKFLISKSDEKYQDVPEVGQSKFNIPIYVQPIDEYDPASNRKNMDLTLTIAQNNGYRLSLQTHKVWNIS